MCNFPTVALSAATANKKANNSLSFSEDQKQALMQIARTLGVPEKQAKVDIRNAETVDPALHDHFLDLLANDKQINGVVGIDQTQTTGAQQQA